MGGGFKSQNFLEGWIGSSKQKREVWGGGDMDTPLTINYTSFWY